MKSFVHKIKPHVQAIRPYELDYVDAAIQLDMNENPIDTPAAIKEAVVKQLQSRPWTRYPELHPHALYQKLSRFVGWPEEGLLIGNGSNEILKMVLTAAIGPDDRVVVVQPSFSVYRQMVQVTGAQFIPVMLTPDLKFDVDAVCRAAKDSDLTIVCTPNNPTGTTLQDEGIRKILAVARGLVIIDEAYHEFSHHTVKGLLPEFPNLIILRTFSKAMAMAGLRIGYLMSEAKLTGEIEKAKLPYNLNFMSIAAAEAGLDHADLLQANVECVIELRDRLISELQAIPGVEVFPTGSNFILFRTPQPGSEIFEALYRRSILIRDVSAQPLLDRCLRVSVGTAEENQTFSQALREVLETAGTSKGGL
ncbi:MAG: histidinol-phosphate transaminase [Acidobacteriia bacterium]|nr:histidinol-phosphate transaminase [Terriglobia bacterium]